MSYLATNLFLPLSAFAAVAAFETTHLVDVLDIVGNMLTYFFDHSRMRSKGSRLTLGVWGLRVCSLDVA